MKVKLLSRVRLFATPWTVAYHAPLSMGFSRQENWSGLPSDHQKSQTKTRKASLSCMFTSTEFLKINGNSPLSIGKTKLNIDIHFFCFSFIIKNYGGGVGLVSKSCPALTFPGTAAHQAPLSVVFSRQEYWSGLSFLLKWIFPTQGRNLGLLHCRWILY